MNYPELISLIDAEFARLRAAFVLLDASANRRAKRAKVTVAQPKKTISKKHRVAIAAAQKARWAKKKAVK